MKCPSEILKNGLLVEISLDDKIVISCSKDWESQLINGVSKKKVIFELKGIKHLYIIQTSQKMVASGFADNIIDYGESKREYSRFEF